MGTFRAFDWTRAQHEFYTLFTDFFDYVTAEWTLTTVEAGVSSATEALGNLAGGQLVVTTDANDNDNDLFQWAGSGGATKETFLFTEGKKLQFVTRFKLSRVDGDFFAGLYITNTDPAGGLTDGIYFRKLAAEAGIKLVVEKDSVEGAVDVITTLVADTFYTLEFYYDGSDDKIKAYVNGVPTGSVPITTAPDDEELALSFGVQNGSANSQILTIDYLGARAER